jgi:hypothetical protein
MFLQNTGICLQVHIALQPRTTSVVKRFVDSILLSDPLKGHFTCFYFLIQRTSLVPHMGHFPIGLDRLHPSYLGSGGQFPWPSPSIPVQTIHFLTSALNMKTVCSS